MKKKLKLSELQVQSFVTSSEKNENTADLLGGSVPTDTDNPLVCVNYSAIGTCVVVLTTVCISPPTHAVICRETFDPQRCVMSIEFGCYDTQLCTQVC